MVLQHPTFSPKGHMRKFPSSVQRSALYNYTLLLPTYLHRKKKACATLAVRSEAFNAYECYLKGSPPQKLASTLTSCIVSRWARLRTRAHTHYVKTFRLYCLFFAIHRIIRTLLYSYYYILLPPSLLGLLLTLLLLHLRCNLTLHSSYS